MSKIEINSKVALLNVTYRKRRLNFVINTYQMLKL